MRRDLTSGEVAALLGVSSKSVTSWIDTGRLPGYRLPTTVAKDRMGKCGDRRVRREDLAVFCREYALPLPRGFGVALLVLSRDSTLVDLLAADLPDWTIEQANNTFDAGFLLTSCTPKALVIDVRIGRVEAGEAARSAKRHKCPVVVLLSEDSPEPLNGEAEEQRLSWPCDPKRLLTCLRRVTAQSHDAVA